MNIPQEITKLINMLINNGHDAYVVGGCVRDFLLGKQPKDYDITTSATPKEIKEVFKECKLVETGIAYGTVTVITENYFVEITTYRKDRDYKDGRHPKTVEFVDSLKEDLKRRDFTVNAVAYNEQKGFVDYFGGREDIQKRIIRCVGDCEQRLKEDSLRIMRGVRFTGTDGFVIEPNTKEQMLKLKDNLKELPRERLYGELAKMLLTDRVEIPICEYNEVVACAFSELAGINRKAVEKINLLDNKEETRLLGICCLLEENKAKGLLQASCISKQTKKAILNAREIAVNGTTETDEDIKALLGSYGETTVIIALEMKKTLFGEDVENAVRRIKRITEKGECFSLKGLQVKGNDISPYCKKEDIGKTLNGLLKQVVAGKIPNEKEALLDAVREMYKK